MVIVECPATIGAVAIGLTFWLLVQLRHPHSVAPALWCLGTYALNWLVVGALTWLDKAQRWPKAEAVSDALGFVGIGAEPGLQVELPDALAEHTVAGVHVLIELELVAQATRHPIAVTEIVLGHEEIAVEPAGCFLQTAFELRARR